MQSRLSILNVNLAFLTSCAVQIYSHRQSLPCSGQEVCMFPWAWRKPPCSLRIWQCALDDHVWRPSACVSSSLWGQQPARDLRWLFAYWEPAQRYQLMYLSFCEHRECSIESTKVCCWLMIPWDKENSVWESICALQVLSDTRFWIALVAILCCCCHVFRICKFSCLPDHRCIPVLGSKQLSSLASAAVNKKEWHFTTQAVQSKHFGRKLMSSLVSWITCMLYFTEMVTCNNVPF